MSISEEIKELSPLDVTKPDIEDHEESQLLGILGDLTLPKSIEPVVREHYEKLWDRFDDNWPKGRIDERINFSTKSAMSKLSNTTSMIEFRDEAQKLYEQYLKNKTHGQSTTDAYYLRNAYEIWGKMNNFAQEYFEYGTDYKQLSSLKIPTDQILEEIKEKSQRMTRMQLESKDDERTSKYIETTFIIPIESPADWDWDSEEIEFGFDENEKISLVEFKEKFSYTSNIGRLDDLKEAYQDGYKITASQLQLLIDRGLVDKKELKETTNNIIKVHPYNKQEDNLSPLYLFAHAIPNDLGDKLKGKSRGWGYASGHGDWGPVTITGRLHDFGESEDHIAIDTDGLTQDEVYKLVELYINCLKEFPLILRKEKRPTTTKNI